MTVQTYKPKKSSPLAQVFTNGIDEDAEFLSPSQPKEPSLCYRCETTINTIETIKTSQVHRKKGRASMVGRMEESLLHNTASSKTSKPIEFEVNIRVNRSTRYRTMMPVVYHTWESEEYQSPYIGTFALSKLTQNGIGIAIKRVGKLRLAILNDEGTKGSKIEIDYDFSRLLPNTKCMVRATDPSYTIQAYVINIEGSLYFSGDMKVIFHMDRSKDLEFDSYMPQLDTQRKEFTILAGGKIGNIEHYTQPCYLCEDDEFLYNDDSTESSCSSVISGMDEFRLVTPYNLEEDIIKQLNPTISDIKIFNDYAADADAYLSDSFNDDYSSLFDYSSCCDVDFE